MGVWEVVRGCLTNRRLALLVGLEDLLKSLIFDHHLESSLEVSLAEHPDEAFPEVIVLEEGVRAGCVWVGLQGEERENFREFCGQGRQRFSGSNEVLDFVLDLAGFVIDASRRLNNPFNRDLVIELSLDELS